jgi:hypothetical protein
VSKQATLRPLPPLVVSFDHASPLPARCQRNGGLLSRQILATWSSHYIFCDHLRHVNHTVKLETTKTKRNALLFISDELERSADQRRHEACSSNFCVWLLSGVWRDGGVGVAWWYRAQLCAFVFVLMFVLRRTSRENSTVEAAHSRCRRRQCRQTEKRS